MRRAVIITLFGFAILSANSLALATTGVKVSVIAIDKLLVNPWEEAQARVISLNDVPLSAEVSGIIRRMDVDVGDSVKPGQLLVAIDDWSHRSQVDQEEAGLEVLHGQLHLAQRQLERVRTLQSSNQTSRERFDTVESEVEVLKARLSQQKGRLEEARSRLARTQVLAPFAAIVVERMGHRGAWISPGSPLLRLVDIEHVDLSAQVAGEAVGRMKEASSLRFLHQGQSYDLRLKTVIPLELSATGTREVRLTFTGAPPIPGAWGRLQWQDSRPHLPAWILVKRDGKFGIFIERDGKATFQPLPQATEGNRTPWPFPDRSWQVIVEGRQSLKDGDLVSGTAAVGTQP
ncbi:MAG: hypothetical protein HW380_2743 [Magnetococcales bacterium]|nr:hypothetical protein [Magnetococcales bacterium]HIJ85815.1 efflux RND transporter periplasmic adaptor subunit [Magnetococcales bacterium]